MLIFENTKLILLFLKYSENSSVETGWRNQQMYWKIIRWCIRKIGI